MGSYIELNRDMESNRLVIKCGENKEKKREDERGRERNSGGDKNENNSKVPSHITDADQQNLLLIVLSSYLIPLSAPANKQRRPSLQRYGTGSRLAYRSRARARAGRHKQHVTPLKALTDSPARNGRRPPRE